MTGLLSRRLFLLGFVPSTCALARTAGRTVRTITALKALPPASNGEVVAVIEPGTGGRFRWEEVSALPPDDALIIAGASKRKGNWVRIFSGAINAHWFGAAPGASALQNSRALRAASEVINLRGGGTLLVPPGEYRVGAQTHHGERGRGSPFDVAQVIWIENCERPVELLGAGVRLKAADGLKFGSFDPITGAPHQAQLPFYDLDYRGNTCRMIHVSGCRGPVRIEGFELDGNLEAYELGGPWGDYGRQVEALGIFLLANTGGVIVANVNVHHHGLDGIQVAHPGLGPDSPKYPITLRNVICDSNARQGLSWVGGSQLTAIDCRFTRTGKARFASAPSAGVDIEAEGSVCRNGHFVRCRFSDNSGPGFLIVGDVADQRLDKCTFIGTTSWSAWPHAPRTVIEDCLFVGSVVNAYPSNDPGEATRFLACRFDDDPLLSPTGSSYHRFLVDLGGGSTNILFDGCSFRAITVDKALSYTNADARYRDCKFTQVSVNPSRPGGIYTGTNRFTSNGPIELQGSRIDGLVIINGKPVRRTIG